MDDSLLRQNLALVLGDGPAHVTIERALQDLNPQNRHKKVNQDVHTVWQELEHMRIAQQDILRYTVDASWCSPRWPEGYWPEETVLVDDTVWQDTLNNFQADFAEVIELIQNSNVNLTDRIPHGKKGHTYLREILLIADHNAYHLGKIVQIRKMLHNWTS